MKKTERVRQVVSGPLRMEDLKHQTEEGWKLVAIEWERDVEAARSKLLWTRCQPMCHSGYRSRRRPSGWKRIRRSGKSCSS